MNKNFSKTLRIGVATAVSALAISLPVAAQVTPDPTTPGTTDTTDTTIDRYDNDFDWGWLGLLGLAGLAGLKRRPEDRDYRRDVTTDPTTTTRY